MAVVGSQLHQIGEIKETEEIYSYYVAMFEIIFGENTMQVAHCYFWLGQYYKEICMYEKAIFSIKKALGIVDKYQKQHWEQMRSNKKEYYNGIDESTIEQDVLENEQLELMRAEANFNLSMIYRKQLLYLQSHKLMVTSLQIYGRTLGKQSLIYANCMFQLGQISFLMKDYQNALVLSKKVLEVYQGIYINDPKNLNL